MQALGRVGEQVAMLMNRAPLDRHAIPDSGNRLLQPWRPVNDEELRPSQAARDQVVEHRTPRLRALAAHVPDRQQHLLAILAHPDHDEE